MNNPIDPAAPVPAAPVRVKPRAPATKPALPWRVWLRTLHRDAGFLAVGLTLVYALSGLAVNHLTDWPDGDASFSKYSRVQQVTGTVPEDESAAVAYLLSELKITGQPSNVYSRRETLQRLQIELADKSVEVRPDVREIEIRKRGQTEAAVYPLDKPLPTNDWQAALEALRRVGIGEEPVSVFRVTIPVRDIEITFDQRILRAQVHDRGADVFEEGREPRFFLHAANWLHLNRGKKAWTFIADGYAIVLLLLAATGVLMVRGRQGLFGRGGIFLLIGVAIPTLYVIFAGP